MKKHIGIQWVAGLVGLIGILTLEKWWIIIALGLFILASFATSDLWSQTAPGAHEGPTTKEE